MSKDIIPLPPKLQADFDRQVRESEEREEQAEQTKQIIQLLEKISYEVQRLTDKFVRNLP